MPLSERRVAMGNMAITTINTKVKKFELSWFESNGKNAHAALKPPYSKGCLMHGLAFFNEC